MDYVSFLEELGLTKNEVKVYVSLLKHGETTSSKIIKDVGINTSKVYESLERLLRRGLVSYTIIKNKKHWLAENPDKIGLILDEQEKKLDKKKEDSVEIIGNLKRLVNVSEKDTEYRIFEGINGIKATRENALKVLKKGDTFYLVLSNFSGENRLEAYFEDFQKRRAKKGINYKAIFNHNLKFIIDKRGKLKYSEIKYIDPQFLAPTWTEIYRDFVVIGVMGDKPSAFVIKNKDIAAGFLNYFNQM